MKTIEIIKLSLNVVLFALAGFGVFIMGFRTLLNPYRLDIFNTAGLSATVISVWAIFCMIQSLLIILPRTLVIGCILLLINNFFIISVNFKAGNTEGALFEAAMMSIPVILIWLGHPYIRWTQINAM